MQNIAKALVGAGIACLAASPAFAAITVISEPSVTGLLAGVAVAGLVIYRLRK